MEGNQFCINLIPESSSTIFLHQFPTSLEATSGDSSWGTACEKGQLPGDIGSLSCCLAYGLTFSVDTPSSQKLTVTASAEFVQTNTKNTLDPGFDYNRHKFQVEPNFIFCPEKKNWKKTNSIQQQALLNCVTICQIWALSTRMITEGVSSSNLVSRSDRRWRSPMYWDRLSGTENRIVPKADF